VRQRARIILGGRLALRKRDVTRCVDELAEFAIGHRRAIDPEAVHGNTVGRRLLRIVLARPHAERTAWYPDHVGMLRRGLLRALHRSNVSIAHTTATPPRNRPQPFPPDD